MLKKLISLALAATMALSLAACGAGGSTESAPVETPFSADLTEFYATLFPDPDNAPAMAEVTGEYLDQLYPGLSEIETRQQLIYTPMITAVAYEIALIEVANADDVSKVQEILQARIDSQIEGGAFYPATVEAWQNQSEIVVRDNYVCLFVGETKDDMVASFNALGE